MQRDNKVLLVIEKMNCHSVRI